MGNASKTQTSVTLDSELMEKGRELARLDRRSFSSWLELAMAKEIRAAGGGKPAPAPKPAAKPAPKPAAKVVKKAAKKAGKKK